MTRFRAFAVRLIASAGIILALLGLMFWAWYPAPYFAINGAAVKAGARPAARCGVHPKPAAGIDYPPD